MKNEEKSSSLYSQNDSGVGYNQNLHIETINKRIQKEKLMAQSILLSVFLVLGIWFYSTQKVDTDYLDGNMIRIANEGGSPWGNFLTTPWRNASFSKSLLFSTLFVTDSTYTQVNPQLAEKYEVSEDGLTYVVTLGENNFWSDGTPITIEDILFSFEGFMRSDEVNSYLSSAFHKIVGATEYAEGKVEQISGISASGNEITFLLVEPQSIFPLMLTQFIPLPYHLLSEVNKEDLAMDIDFFRDLNVVSSGQFVVDHFDEEGNLILTKNPFYTKKTTDIEEIVLYWDYENVELDYYTTTDPTKMVSYRSMKGFQEHMVDVLFYRYFLFNMENSENPEGNVAMQDIRVRQAIYHALDVEELFEDVYFGKGSLFYGGSLTLAEEIYEYNPSKAIQLLEEAGYDFDRTFKISYYSTDDSSRIFLEKVKEYLENIGLTVELEIKMSTVELYDEANYDMTMKNLSAFNTQDWFSEYLSTNPLMSHIFPEVPKFDQLYDDLSAVTNEEDFDKVLLELIELEQELLYKMPMFLIGEAIYVNSNRLYVPDDIIFGNTRYFCDIQLEDWYVKKG